MSAGAGTHLGALHGHGVQNDAPHHRIGGHDFAASAIANISSREGHDGGGAEARTLANSSSMRRWSAMSPSSTSVLSSRPMRRTKTRKTSASTVAAAPAATRLNNP